MFNFHINLLVLYSHFPHIFMILKIFRAVFYKNFLKYFIFLSQLFQFFKLSGSVLPSILFNKAPSFLYGPQYNFLAKTFNIQLISLQKNNREIGIDGDIRNSDILYYVALRFHFYFMAIKLIKIVGLRFRIILGYETIGIYNNCKEII